MNVNDDESKMWVVIDSDGEDSETKSVSRFALKENDLISFLNQIPFADIFRQVNFFVYIIICVSFALIEL